MTTQTVTNTDYALARKNMIDCQIATMGVIDPVLLDVLRHVPRELFVPEHKMALAYSDDDLALGDGSYLMEPAILARMIQAGEPHRNDAVLAVADTSGYVAAVMSRMAQKVIALESTPNRLDHARRVWDMLGYGNITTMQGDVSNGCPDHAPYNLIFVNGSVARVPYDLTEQLAEGGRLVSVVRDRVNHEGHALINLKLANGAISSKILFDAATPYIQGLAPERSFVF